MNRRMRFPWGINADRPPGTIVHKTPQMPIMIDGIETEPEAVQEFRGYPLYTVVDSRALDDRMLQIFTSVPQAEQYCKHLIDNEDPFWVRRNTFRPPSGAALAPPGPPGHGYVELYEDINLGGCVWYLPDAPTVGDFTKYWACGWLWFFWKNLDNQASSVLSVSSWTITILCAGINLGKPWCFLPGLSLTPDLSKFGFNDLASSMHFMNLAPV